MAKIKAHAPLSPTENEVHMLKAMCDKLLDGETVVDSESPELFIIREGNLRHIYHWYELCMRVILPRVDALIQKNSAAQWVDLHDTARNMANPVRFIFVAFQTLPDQPESAKEQKKPLRAVVF